ncbi:MAG TPA: ATP-binding protein [Sphingomonas sp.]|nr:ATP-binding protein [Sphingomonas sp.]
MALGFLAITGAGIVATEAIPQSQAQSKWVDHTYRVQRAISQWRVLGERLEAARRGYLLRDQMGQSKTFYDTSTQIEPALAELERLTADNPRQQANLREAMVLSRRHLATLARSVALVRAGRRDEAVRAFNVDESAPLIRRLRALADRMLIEEDRLLKLRDAAQADGYRRFLATLGGAGLLLVLVASGSLWIIVRYTHDLTASRDALGALNADLEGAVRERTADLQRANEEIQRFAYIVSHDLRSPLVNIMGFTAELESAAGRIAAMIEQVEAEAPHLVHPDVKTAMRDELPEAIGFIRTSTAKMDRLINAILRLSREGRRPIMAERLDMGALMENVIANLRHRTDELGARISIRRGLPDIVSDRLAIEQIASNIVENAIKYLDPARRGEVEISGHIEEQRAIFEIADNGRGIDPKDHERIFDLFRRSGRQDQPGEGIGLAHTRTLAYRLGGTISVESELGKGATFRISLPLTLANEQG